MPFINFHLNKYGAGGGGVFEQTGISFFKRKRKTQFETGISPSGVCSDITNNIKFVPIYSFI